MIYKDETDLLKDIKENRLKNVFLLYGSESYLRELYRKKLLEAVVPSENREMNLHLFDGDKLDVSALFDVVETFPFFTEKRCVVVDGLDYEGMDNDSRKKLLEMIKDIPDFTVVVLVVRKEDFNPQKSTKAKELVKAVDEVGCVAALHKRQRSQMISFIKSKLKPWQATAENDVCVYLLERCEEDMQTLTTEVEKLGAYAMGKEVTKEMVDKVTIAAMDASIYDLSKAVLRGDYQGAMTILQELLYQKEPPVAILGTLAGTYIDLYRGKKGLSAGKDAKQIGNDFEYRGREFRIQNAVRDCRGYSEQFLQDALDCLCEADWKLKSSRAADTVILEQAITQLFVCRGQS